MTALDRYAHPADVEWLLAELAAAREREEKALDYVARAAAGNIDRARVPLTQREWLERFERSEEREETLREALRPLRALAQDILDTLASGSEPWAATGYGYEHMGDFARDVRPLCEALVALSEGES